MPHTISREQAALPEYSDYLELPRAVKEVTERYLEAVLHVAEEQGFANGYTAGHHAGYRRGHEDGEHMRVWPAWEPPPRLRRVLDRVAEWFARALDFGMQEWR